MQYPRYQFRRTILRNLIRAALFTLTDLTIEGRENIPTTGPCIAIANHFHFADPLLLIHIMPPHTEFLAGTQNPSAPWIVKSLPGIYGVIRVLRGTASRAALRESGQVLQQNGFIGVFPEGGSWAEVLRPARPGTAMIATLNAAPIVPIGIDGMTALFKQRRPRVTVRIGEPIGPFSADGRGKTRRRQLDKISDTMMQAIADLLPPAQRGVYSDDPALREAAQAVADFPYHDLN